MELFVEQIESEVPDVQSRGVRVGFLGRRDGVDPRSAGPHRRRRGRQPGRPGDDHVHRLQLRRARRDRRRRPRPGGVGGARAGRRRLRRRPPAGLEELVTEDALRARLYAPEMHDPELLIRTSGEERISNFLLWQLAYTELYFSAKLWPDFGPDDLDEALAVYATPGATVRWPLMARPQRLSPARRRAVARARHARHRRRGAGLAGAGRDDPRRPAVLRRGARRGGRRHQRVLSHDATLPSPGAGRLRRCRAHGSGRLDALAAGPDGHPRPVAAAVVRSGRRAGTAPRGECAHRDHHAGSRLRRARGGASRAHPQAPRRPGLRPDGGLRRLGRRHRGLLHRALLRRYPDGSRACRPRRPGRASSAASSAPCSWWSSSACTTTRSASCTRF